MRITAVLHALEDNFFSYILTLHKNKIFLDINTLLLISTGIVGRSILPSDKEKVKFTVELIKTYFNQFSISVSWWITPNSQPEVTL